jgi:hypothetical protein
MADNVAITQGSGTNIGADEISSVKYQRVKIIVGADGVNDGDVASGNPMPVSAASLPLPTGAATSAKQLADNHNVVVTSAPTTAVTNAGITSIDSKITACNTGAVVVSSGALNADIRVGGAAVTTSNPVPIMPPASGSLAVNDAGGALTVDGTVAVSGSVAVTNAGITTIAGAVSGTEMQVDVLTIPTNVPTTIGSGTTTVTTAGTRVALAGSTACRKVSICAKEANTGRIFYGGNAVSATSGAFLYAGASADIEISNLSSVYIDSSVNGEGVQYTYVA